MAISTTKPQQLILKEDVATEQKNRVGDFKRGGELRGHPIPLKKGNSWCLKL